MMETGSGLRDYLQSFCAGETILFFPNPGNAGDTLIAHATYQLFHDLHVHFEIVRDLRQAQPDGRIVVYGGGGNLVPYYHYARDVIQSLHLRARRMLVLPSSILGNQELLASLGSNTEILCREAVSYEYVLGMAPRARVHLFHDMAFNLDVERTLRENPLPIQPHLPRLALRALLFEMDLLPDLTRLARAKELAAFRTDQEALAGDLPPGNLDLARRLSYGADREDVARYVSWRMLYFLRRFERIRTDRLHICIAGALLGKQVEFFANRYHKNKAVFEYSLRDRYPNVRWMGADPNFKGNEP
jgi:exopolysaccharide biosynthesis predicted pyruvyltransferase EpsI